MKKTIYTTLIIFIICLIGIGVFGIIGLSNAEAVNVLPTIPTAIIEETTVNCNHSETFERTTASTCSKMGKKEIICKKCSEIIVVNYLTKKEHVFKENIITEATCTQTGEKNLVCDICQYKTKSEIIKKAKHNIKHHTIKSATCTEAGITQEVCNDCHTVISTISIPKISHNFKVASETPATPFSDGLTIYRCTYCRAINEVVQNKITIRDFYIPSVGINVDVHVGECNQYNTDNYDVNCSYLYGKRHPIIFGHDYNTLGKIYGVKNGDLIYLKQDGEIITYRVTISDIGLNVYSNGGVVNIVSASTGEKCLFYDEGSAIHIFTCYYDIRYGNCRWMIVAEKI